MARKKADAKPTLPIDVMVEGTKHHVIAIEKTYWACLHPDDGKVHVHAGRLLLDGQEDHPFRMQPKPCYVCKRPAYTYVSNRSNSRAVHDMCAPGAYTTVMPDELTRQVEFGVAADLGATRISVTPHQ